MSSGYQQDKISEAAIEMLGFGPELDALVAESVGVQVSWYKYEIPPSGFEFVPVITKLKESLDFLVSVGAESLTYDESVPSFSESLFAVKTISRTNWAWTIHKDQEIVKAILIVVYDGSVDTEATEGIATMDEGLGDPDRAEALAMSRAIAKWGLNHSNNISKTTAMIVMEALNEE